jgi:hypothetical protein
MTLWWLTFRGGGAVIIEGISIAHARLLAAVNEFGRASNFIEGYPIDPEFIELIPEDYIGRELLPAEAKELLELLKHGSLKYYGKSRLEIRPQVLAG